MTPLARLEYLLELPSGYEYRDVPEMTALVCRAMIEVLPHEGLRLGRLEDGSLMFETDKWIIEIDHDGMMSIYHDDFPETDR